MDNSDVEDGDIYSFGGQMNLKFSYNPTLIPPDSNDESDDENSDDETGEEESYEEPISKWRRVLTDGNDNRVKATHSSAQTSPKANDIDDILLTPPPVQSKAKRSRRAKIVERTLQTFENSLRTLQDLKSDSPGLHYTANDSECEPKKKIKVKHHGILEKWGIAENEPFSSLAKKIALAEDVPTQRVSFFFKENRIELHDTLKSLNIGITDVIECIILDGDAANLPINNSDLITLKIQMASGKDKFKYSLSKHAPVSSIISKHCQTKNIEMDKVNVFFDGDEVSIKRTPSELELEDEDVLDIFVS